MVHALPWRIFGKYFAEAVCRLQAVCMRTIFGCLGILFFWAAEAQELRVRASDSGKPLEGVLFLMEQPFQAVSTDADGWTDLSVFPEEGQIQIRLLGYASQWTGVAELRRTEGAFFLTPNGSQLSQVTVSATRWVQARNESPFKVRGIPAEKVALEAPQNAADLLGQSGEVFIQKSQQGGGSPMIRGFAANRLLLSVDGVRMNTAIFRSGNLQNVLSIDPFSLESTEVLFGPGSVMYGSDAIGGVLNFYTLKPSFSHTDSLLAKVRVESRFSTANQELSNHLDLRLGNKHWALVLGATQNRYGDLKMGSRGPEDYLRTHYVGRIGGRDSVLRPADPLLQSPSGFVQEHFLFKASYNDRKKLQITYSLKHSQTTAYDRYDRLIQQTNGQPDQAEWRYAPQLWSSHLLHLRYTKKNQLFDAADLRVAYQLFEEGRISRRFGEDERLIRLELVEAFSVNADLVRSLGGWGQLFYGAEWVRNDVSSTARSENINSGVQTPAASRYPTSQWYSAAVFLSWQKTWKEQWTLQGGTRWNVFGLRSDFSNNRAFYPLPFEQARTDDRSLTGNVGVEWHPDEDWDMSLHLSSAFRSPNVDDMGKIFDSEPGRVVVPNPDLRAEKANILEWDFSRKIAKGVELDVALYTTWMRDAMLRQAFSLQGADSVFYDGVLSEVQAVQNTGSLRVWGLEFRLDVAFSQKLHWISSWSQQQGIETDGQKQEVPLRHAAPAFGRSGLYYEANRLCLSLYSLFSAQMSAEDLPPSEQAKPHLYALDANGAPYSPAWYTLNVKAELRLLEQLHLRLGLENFTDQRYRPYSSGLAGAGINGVFGLSWEL